MGIPSVPSVRDYTSSEVSCVVAIWGDVPYRLHMVSHFFVFELPSSWVEHAVGFVGMSCAYRERVMHHALGECVKCNVQKVTAGLIAQRWLV